MVTAASEPVVYGAGATNAAGWIRDLMRHGDLLYMITWRELKVKYKQSVMGVLWAILMPIVIVSAGITVRYAFAVMSGQPLTVADLAGVTVKAVPWAFFVSAIRFGANSLIANANLVTKIYMPREIFPFAAVLSALVDFVIATGVLVVVLSAARIGVSVHLLWVPVLVLVLVLQTVALALLLSGASLFFRDVKYLVDIFLMFAIFFTPVFFEAAMFGEWAPLLMLNPVAPVLEGLHAVVVRHAPPPLSWLAYSAAVGAVGCLVGIVFFKRVEPFFAESV
jgi:ABC-type polysaccharide/polyol phosphate export permease